MAVTEITVEELAKRRASEAGLVLLDVRDPDEWETVHVEGSLHVPMAEIPQRVGELPKDVPIAVMCHHGGRSARVARFLAANGFADVLNVEDGIDAYAERVDPSLARY